LTKFQPLMHDNMTRPDVAWTNVVS